MGLVERNSHVGNFPAPHPIPKQILAPASSVNKQHFFHETELGKSSCLPTPGTHPDLRGKKVILSQAVSSGIWEVYLRPAGKLP